jgi:ParB-like chromosome segregation protein Spo0J
VQAHKAAEIFPLMSAVEFDGLVMDILENGQREPIIVHNGEILDGRNRFRACQDLGVEPLTVEWDGKGTAEAFVVSMNLHRRHLNESQRALIAARLASVKLGTNRFTKVDGEISLPTAAALLNVDRATVGHAKTVLREGTPEEIQAVEQGSAAVSTIAKQIRSGKPPEKRRSRNSEVMQTGKNPERIQRAQMNAELWARLSDALLGLTSLPLPSDVAEIVAGNVNRRRVVDDRLSRSLQWLKDFDHAWRNRDEDAA